MDISLADSEYESIRDNGWTIKSPSGIEVGIVKYTCSVVKFNGIQLI